MAGPRIALIGATVRALPPVRAALARDWPDADAISLVDEALETDRARDDLPDIDFDDRFARLIDYARAAGARGILFTCSAFSQEIARARAGLDLPVLRPDEAAIDAALARAAPVRALLTFPPSRASLEAQLDERRAAAAAPPPVAIEVVADALDALRAGDVETHDRLVAERIAAAPEDVILMGQYALSDAGAAARAANPHKTVVTGPDLALAALKARLGLT